MKKRPKLIAVSLIFALLLMSLPASMLAKPARTVPDGYNQNDYLKVRAFLETADENGVKNGEMLTADYDPDNPETWSFDNWGDPAGFIWGVPENAENDELRLISVLCFGCALVGTLDLDGCSALVTLSCGDSKVEAVTVHGCESLEMINVCNDEHLTEGITELDVSECPNLVYFDCGEANLAEVDVSHNPELAYLIIYGNHRITELDVSNNPNLWDLDLEGCSLTELDVSHNPGLYEIVIDGNSISSLDLSNQASLQVLSIGDTNITEIDLSACTMLRNFQCLGNSFRTIDLSDNGQLILDRVEASGEGYVGGYFWNQMMPSMICAYPEEGSIFEGWYNEEGELVSADLNYNTNGDEGTVFIARFSGGSEPTPGDVDGNGEVAVSDAVLALRAAMGIHELSAEQTAAADMDENGSIEVSDAIIILRVAMGLLG